jgi:hypothetical protein
LENIVKTMELLFDGQQPIRDGVLCDLASYVVLDALIGNTDRHHENWGLVWRIEKLPDGGARLHLKTAPSFDHASSLGRELTDERRIQILGSLALDAYVTGSRARGGIYLRSDDRYGANPLRLAQVGSRLYPDYFRRTLRQVAECPIGALHDLVNEVPNERMSMIAKNFAKEYLSFTHHALSGLAQ